MKKIFLFLILTLPTFAQINSNGDFQIWNREIVYAHFSNHWTFSCYAETRFGDNASKLYQAFVHTQFSYKPAPWISFGPGYRQTIIRSPINSNHWVPVYTPLAHLSFFLKAAGWQFSDRNRVQCELKKSNPFPWLYRNRFRIVPPWAITRFCINPYVDNEIFIYQARGFAEDRLCSGVLFWFHENLSGQLYYMRRFQKTTHWIHQNILNITLLLSY